MVQTRKMKRRAASLLEIILGLPVLLILLFAVVQFGLLQANQQTLKMASRAGALAATELVINPSDTDPPPEVLAAINEVLQESGLIDSGETIQGVGAVHLRYLVYDNGAGMDVAGIASVGTGCDPPTPPTLTAQFVQVTVCLPATRLTPNTMAPFGVDFSSRYVSETSLFRHELVP
ncbi:TadE/TadG family type IV pilus assembly protein [Bremerella sp. JC817]|uniref:TadE/TadG family type IV pilus assembly protein n=1 Tax=Bremerella sp. JC817 TaxID=3231756 RepID=UPI00345816C7